VSERLSAAAAARQAVTELWRVREVLDRLGRQFRDAGHELYLVGGTVRDALLGRLSSDLDFTTDAHPERTLALVGGLGATWTVGAAFGTIGVQVGEHRCEITTYRSDSYDAASRKPEVRFGDSLDGDLERRDFTVNAMAVAVPLDVGKGFVDPFGGLDDLAASLLRTPGPAERSFDDDPLRMLRAARFAGQLGFAVDPAAGAAITAMAGRLEKVSAERIRDELVKLVCAPRPRPGLQLLVDSGLAAVPSVLPELVAIAETVDEHRRHKDVWAHTLIVLEQAIGHETDGPDLTLRLAALLHDIGKPATKEFGRDGSVSFHHHEVVGARLAARRLKALKFPAQVVSDVSRLVELHLRFHGYGRGEWTDAAVRRYVRDAGPLLPRLHALTRSDCTTRNQRKAQSLAAAYDSLVERIDQLGRAEDLAALRPDLDGNAIMTLLGIGPGPAVGRAYQHLLALRIDRGPLPHDEAADELRRWAVDNGVPGPAQPIAATVTGADPAADPPE
jgi:poly(A) polymerase